LGSPSKLRLSRELDRSVPLARGLCALCCRLASYNDASWWTSSRQRTCSPGEIHETWLARRLLYAFAEQRGLDVGRSPKTTELLVHQRRRTAMRASAKKYPGIGFGIICMFATSWFGCVEPVTTDDGSVTIARRHDDEAERVNAQSDMRKDGSQIAAEGQDMLMAEDASAGVEDLSIGPSTAAGACFATSGASFGGGQFVCNTLWNKLATNCFLGVDHRNNCNCSCNTITGWCSCSTSLCCR
jgi:hypothetical protein